MLFILPPIVHGIKKIAILVRTCLTIIKYSYIMDLHIYDISTNKSIKYININIANKDNSVQTLLIKHKKP